MKTTPRTDAAFALYQDFPHDEKADPWLLASELERELAEARKMQQDRTDERDNALSDWRQADTDSIRAIHERNEARAQRDSLAAALRDVVEGSHGAVVCAKQTLVTIIPP